MQLTEAFLVAGSNPGQVNAAAPLPPPPTVGRPGFELPTKTLCRLCYHSTGGCVIAICFPTAWSLLSENF